jgi:outer membrane immunogenic protein
MRKLSLIIIAATLVVGPTITWAADLPPSPPPRVPAAYVPAVLPVYNWAGVYVGINGGWGWGNGKFTIEPNTAFPIEQAPYQCPLLGE